MFLESVIDKRKHIGGTPNGMCRVTTGTNNGLSEADTHYLQMAPEPSGFLTLVRIYSAQSPQKALREAQLFAEYAEMDPGLILPLSMSSETIIFLTEGAPGGSFAPVVCEGMSEWYVKSQGETATPYETANHAAVDWKATEMQTFFGAIGDSRHKVQLQLVLALNHHGAAAKIAAAGLATNQDYLCTIGLTELAVGMSAASTAFREGHRPLVLIANT